MPLHDKPIEVLRRRRNESAFYLLVLMVAAGYVGKVHFADGYPVPHFVALAFAAVLGLSSAAAMVKAYHQELQKRTNQF